MSDLEERVFHFADAIGFAIAGSPKPVGAPEALIRFNIDACYLPAASG